MRLDEAPDALKSIGTTCRIGCRIVAFVSAPDVGGEGPDGTFSQTEAYDAKSNSWTRSALCRRRDLDWARRWSGVGPSSSREGPHQAPQIRRQTKFSRPE